MRKNSSKFIKYLYNTRYQHSKGRRCIPNVDIEVHVETHLNVDLSSSAQLKIQVKIQFQTFLKNQIFGFPWCSTREDLSIDVSITNVGLILTKLGWFLLSGYGHLGYRQTRHKKKKKKSTQGSKLVVSCR